MCCALLSRSALMRVLGAGSFPCLAKMNWKYYFLPAGIVHLQELREKTAQKTRSPWKLPPTFIRGETRLEQEVCEAKLFRLFDQGTPEWQFWKDGSPWHPVCHHPDDGHCPQQGGTSPLPGQVGFTFLFLKSNPFCLILFAKLSKHWKPQMAVDWKTGWIGSLSPSLWWGTSSVCAGTQVLHRKALLATYLLQHIQAGQENGEEGASTREARHCHEGPNLPGRIEHLKQFV